MATTITLADGTPIRLAEEADYAEYMRDTVEKELAALRVEKEVPLSTGGTLHAENYLVPGARRGVILIHGYTESAEKLRELAWYYVQAGFSVFSYDQRGHGRSVRQLEDLTISHVDNFHEYINDLEEFILREVRPVMRDKPLYLFAHSMGGAIGAHFLLRHPDTFRRVVLNSPMIAPSSAPFPLWMGKAMAAFFCLTGQGKKRAFISGPYDPEKEVFETSCATSPARFRYYWEKRVAHDYLQNCSPSYNWVYQAAAQTRELMNKKDAEKVTIPVLLLQAGLDGTVLLPAQDRFISLLPNGKLRRFDTAKHEIYLSTDDVIRPYIQEMLDFLVK